MAQNAVTSQSDVLKSFKFGQFTVDVNKAGSGISNWDDIYVTDENHDRALVLKDLVAATNVEVLKTQYQNIVTIHEPGSGQYAVLNFENKKVLNMDFEARSLPVTSGISIVDPQNYKAQSDLNVITDENSCKLTGLQYKDTSGGSAKDVYTFNPSILLKCTPGPGFDPVFEVEPKLALLGVSADFNKIYFIVLGMRFAKGGSAVTQPTVEWKKNFSFSLSDMKARPEQPSNYISLISNR